jgi:hypothetical protein
VRLVPPGKTAIKLRREFDTLATNRVSRCERPHLTSAGIPFGERPMFLISRHGQEPIVVEHFKAIVLAFGSIKPGRYVIDEICDAREPARDAARQWGIGIKWADGSVEIESDSPPA